MSVNAARTSATTYVELHARSAFSFLEGSSVPEELVARAAALDQPALAILDRDNVSGAARFHMAAKKAGIRAHIGAEITCTDGHRYPLLAENRKGYQNLCRLITRMKMRAKKGEGAATPEEFAEFSEGLVHLASRPEARLLDLFGAKNIFVELQRHYNRDQEARNQALIDFARQHRLPLVATNGVSHATPGIARSARRPHLRPPQSHHPRSRPAALHQLRAASEKRARNVAPLRRPARSHRQHTRTFRPPPVHARRSRLPISPLPRAARRNHELLPAQARRRRRTQSLLSDCILSRSLPPRPPPNRARARAHRKTRPGRLFPDRLGHRRVLPPQNILVQGRGSAANSAVCYSLGITAVDPVAMELLFERFLSEERGEWPDIDLDLPSGDQRERAIQYVYQRYGKLGAAMTANVITYRGRSAVRDIGKVLGFDEPDLARISALVPTWGWTDPKETAERQFREAGFPPTIRGSRNSSICTWPSRICRATSASIPAAW